MAQVLPSALLLSAALFGCKPAGLGQTEAAAMPHKLNVDQLNGDHPAVDQLNIGDLAEGVWTQNCVLEADGAYRSLFYTFFARGLFTLYSLNYADASCKKSGLSQQVSGAYLVGARVASAAGEVYHIDFKQQLLSTSLASAEPSPDEYNIIEIDAAGLHLGELQGELGTSAQRRPQRFLPALTQKK